jgi:hypothetical protein
VECLVRISAARRVVVDDVFESGREIPVGVADAKEVGRIDHKISLVHFGGGDVIEWAGVTLAPSHQQSSAPKIDATNLTGALDGRFRLWLGLEGVGLENHSSLQRIMETEFVREQHDGQSCRHGA